MSFLRNTFVLLAFPLLPGLASGQSWIQAFRASDAASEDLFGASIAVTAERVVVGAPFADGGALLDDSGRVYVYRQQGGSWIEEARLEPSDPASAGQFGTSVAIQGERIVVGAPWARWNNIARGAAYVFEFSGGAWSEVARFHAADTLLADRFGEAVDLEGEEILVGAPGKDGSEVDEGAAYLFGRVVGWQERAKLTASDGEFLDHFGVAVSLEPGRAAVGARGEDTGPKESGAAYVFEGFATAWNEVAKLKADDAIPHEGLGVSLDLCGSTLAVGAPGGSWAGPGSGAVVIFEGLGGVWTQGSRIVPAGVQTGDHFGHALALDGDKLAVGGFGHGGFVLDGGAVWLFGRAGDSWLELGVFASPTLLPHQAFGMAVALDGLRLAAATPLDSAQGYQQGSADLWSIASAPTHSLYCFGLACPCGNLDGGAGCANSTGRGALLEPSGSLSLSRDDLVLSVRGLVANQFAVVLMGPGSVSTQFGDGIRCADAGHPLGPGYHIFGPASSTSAMGSITLGPGRFAAVPGLAAGDTRYLQAWYRDSQGPCSSTFNVSNALELSFTP